MTFWVLTIALAAAAAAILLRTAARSADASGMGEAHSDLTVYRGQLAEVDRDLERGLIGATDAATLRTEISRRILDLDRAGPAATAGAKPAGLVLPAIALVAAIALAYGLYDRLGAPGYADLPHAERIANSEKLRAARPTQAQAEADAAAKAPKPPAPDPQFADLMAKLRAAVAARPTDEVGLRLLARNERTLGNIAAAAKAQGQLVALLGDKAGVDDWAALSDDLVFAAGGLVTADAEKALAETLRRDPANGTARFYTGLMEAQTGRPDRAFTIWNALLKDSPPQAPWVPYIEGQMEMLAAAAGHRLDTARHQRPRCCRCCRCRQHVGRRPHRDDQGHGRGPRRPPEDPRRHPCRMGTTDDRARRSQGHCAGARRCGRWRRWHSPGDPAGLEQVRAAAATAGVTP
jgi:cytochrome c-type biogenesis protein CcmH